jgi:hypothetical protein
LYQAEHGRGTRALEFGNIRISKKKIESKLMMNKRYLPAFAEFD